MHREFNLESAQFSDSSDDDITFPSHQLLQLYNREYSFVLQQTSKFFTYCKQSIQKFISLNQFGAGFSLPLLYTTILQIEQNSKGLSESKKLLLEEKKENKKRYEGNFHSILKRMGKVIEDLIDFQVNFKRDYLGQNIKKPETIKARINRMKKIAFQQTISVSPVSSVKQGFQEETQYQDLQEKKIRAILQKKMYPETIKIQKVCNSNQSPETNIKKLIEKVDNMRINTKESKTKEEKIFQIFNRKKFSNSEASETSFTENSESKGKYIDTYSPLRDQTKGVYNRMIKKRLENEQILDCN